MSAQLQNAGIVIARAEGRGESLRQSLLKSGAEVLLFPVIAIRALPETTLPDATPDWLIFTSVPAVEYGLKICQRRMSASTRVAAIGEATANTLRDAGVTVHAVPERQETEGLLMLPEFHAVQEADCWIIKGAGGRELLAGALAARGARVTLLDVYERGLPQTPVEPLLEWWRAGRVNALVVSSRSSLVNLHAMLDNEGRTFLRETQLVMPTERMLKLALELHIRPAPLIATDISDQALLATLQAWWRDRHQDSR